MLMTDHTGGKSRSSDYRYALDAEQVSPGSATPVEIDGRWYAVCNEGGRFYACDNLCPHAGGPLGRGEIDDGRVICPIHHWPWDLKPGLTDPDMPWMRLKLYRCKLREGKVYVDVSAPIPPKPM